MSILRAVTTGKDKTVMVYTAAAREETADRIIWRREEETSLPFSSPSSAFGDGFTGSPGAIFHSAAGCERYTGGMSEVTRLLDAVVAGDRKAAAELFPLVYDELRKLAAARMAAEAPHHTLQPTALVHEAYLRLIGDQQFDGRGHFFAAAAEAMRRILVNHARDRKRLKRGGRLRLELLDHADSLTEDPDLVLSLDDLLTRLGEEDFVAARVAHLHLFAGLSVEETGEVMGLSRAVAFRNWKYARAWLREALEK